MELLKPAEEIVSGRRDASHMTEMRQTADRRSSPLRTVSAKSGAHAIPGTDSTDMIAMIGEYVGTVLFMIFALGGTNVALTPATTITGQTTAGEEQSAAQAVNTSNLLYIALSFGFSLAVNAWIFFRVSGGLFNPAVSLGMALVGAVTPTRAALLSFVQVLGGITGAAIIDALTPGTM
jgi:aquaporin related protein